MIGKEIRHEGVCSLYFSGPPLGTRGDGGQPDGQPEGERNQAEHQCNKPKLTARGRMTGECGEPTVDSGCEAIPTIDALSGDGQGQATGFSARPPQICSQSAVVRCRRGRSSVAVQPYFIGLRRPGMQMVDKEDGCTEQGLASSLLAPRCILVAIIIQ
ncbi:uncharacterized protein BO95DRAFT_21224 [Aspergillus brunneoviolaceus CBS 621.78]|uniref:Uncharacterized protein n=1 Tax=Aspergillus brunneoviolaceus CBS 621.78 TaxID=1450534 RepID=A0ACD1FTF6_9EURO|nr:hypothetical protein BO95DRAFT_21224 [Aspergillus brunneoviolaceus CBS 621.78]RAH40239.1 hypothetical protein BO95DRAFT_21224 [Aspergillus brunneoviolaceus CBS 621.78]